MSDTTHNERVKLLATTINTVAMAFVVAGFVAPAVSGQLAGGGRALIAAAWFCLGAGLHGCAHLVLGRLRP